MFEFAPALPLRNWQFHVVELPGRITSGSPDGAIAALGGMDAISKAFSNEMVPLELRLRAEDPFAHPILGEVVETANLLLKVTKKRRKTGSGPGGMHIDSDYKLVTEIVGIITKTGRFRAIADFQYVVDAEDPMRKLKKSLNDFDIEGISHFEFSKDQGIQPDLRMIPPPIFSRIEWSLGYRYQQFTDELKQPPTRAGDTAPRTSKQRPPRNPMLKVRRDTVHIPQAPSQHILQTLATHFGNHEALLARLEHLFTLRPIYTLRALSNLSRDANKRRRRNPVDASKLVSFLATKFAYFITFGPWQECWVRYGYDPRAEREARMYQIISMRMIKAPMALKRAKRVHTGVAAGASGTGSSAQPNEEDDEKSHIFDGTLWKGCARMQICDLTDPDVVRILQSTRGRKTFDQKDGWFDAAVIENIRKVVRRKIMQQTGRAVEDDGDLLEYFSNDDDEEIEGEGDGAGEEEEDGEEFGEEGGGENTMVSENSAGRSSSGGFMDTDLEPPTMSASVSSKIDALMRSLQSSQPAAGGTENSQIGLIDDDEDDEFDYFDGDD